MKLEFISIQFCCSQYTTSIFAHDIMFSCHWLHQNQEASQSLWSLHLHSFIHSFMRLHLFFNLMKPLSCRVCVCVCTYIDQHMRRGHTWISVDWVAQLVCLGTGDRSRAHQATGSRVISPVLGLFHSQDVWFWQQEAVGRLLSTPSSPEEAGVGTTQIAKDMLAIMFHPSVSFISRLPFVIRFVTPVNKRPMQMWFICIWIDVLSPLTYASNAFWYISK